MLVCVLCGLFVFLKYNLIMFENCFVPICVPFIFVYKGKSRDYSHFSYLLLMLAAAVPIVFVCSPKPKTKLCVSRAGGHDKILSAWLFA